MMSCTEKQFACHEERNKAARKEFVSLQYNHFEGGVLFENTETGLDILWDASFRKSSVYKENAGFFVNGGLLILPNHTNEHNHATITALPTQIIGNKLFVLYREIWLEALGIIHTHPDAYCQARPSPGNDYQYCYLGIHNYVMDRFALYDAHKDRFSRERYTLLGNRNDYHHIPFVAANRFLLANR